MSEFGVSLSVPGMGADQASATIKSELSARRAALREVQLRNPNGKLAKRAGVLMLDMDAFEDRILEAGGDEAFLYFVTAQVASGVSLKQVCDHYMLEYGLLWAWMGAQPERLTRYEIALRGLADSYVAEANEIADTPQIGEIRKTKSDGSEEVTTEDMLGHRKLRVDTKLKLAGVLDKKRFGTEKAGVMGGTGLVIDAALTFAAAELLGRIQRPNNERVVGEG